MAEDLHKELMEAMDREMPSPSSLKRPIFGLGKTFGGNFGMARSVVLFSKPPVDEPLSVCCSLPGVFVGHKFMLDTVMEKLNAMPPSDVFVPKVVSLRFVDRNVLLGTQHLPNRWVITVNCQQARDELLRVGLFILSKKIPLKLYDQVQQAEYKEFKEFEAEQKTLFARLERRQP